MTALRMPALDRHLAPGLRTLVILGLGACHGADMGPDPGSALPAHLEVVTGGGQTGTVGEALGDAVVARVTDADGRGVSGVLVTFAAPGAGGLFAPESRRTDERGEAQAIWTLGSRAGVLSAKVAGGGLTPAPLSATALPAAPARLAFEAMPDGVVAGVALNPPVVVAVHDDYGNVVPTSSAEIRLRVNKGILVGGAAGDAVNGMATFVDLHIDQAGLGYVITATAEGLTPSESGAFAVAAGTATRLVLSAGDAQRALAGAAVPIAPAVEVLDANGNGISGVSVTFTVTGGGGTVTPGAVITGADGRAASTGWTLGTTVGANTLRASVAAVLSEAVEFSAEADPGTVDASQSTVSATPTSILAGATSIVTVTAKDAFGNPVPGASVKLNASGSGNTLVQPPPTDADGATNGSFRSTAAGGKTISVEAGGIMVTERVTIVVESPPTVTSVEVSPSQSALLVDQAVSLTATVLDDQGRPMDGLAVTWSSSDVAIARVNAEGVVTALAPGRATITATSAGKWGSAELSVSFGEGALTGLTYCTVEGVADKMDVYLPSASKPRPLPVAVHVHGGGWISGSRSSGTRFAELKNMLLARGYLVVSLDYRLAPAHRYPSQIQDVKCAIRHLRARASQYGLDPDRIGAWGGSAGGQLVALLGTADGSAGFDEVGGFQGQSSGVQAVIALSAITDFTSPEELRDNYSRAFWTWPDPTSPEMIEASPVTHVSSDDAPFFLIVGDEDPLVLPEQSVRMNQLLQAAGVPSSLLRVLHADHDLQPTTVTPIDPASETINSRMAEFFDQHLR